MACKDAIYGVGIFGISVYGTLCPAGDLLYNNVSRYNRKLDHFDDTGGLYMKKLDTFSNSGGNYKKKLRA